MPQSRLSPDDQYFIKKMKEVKKSNCETAKLLGVTEGAVRYRLRRALSGEEDGRKSKTSRLDRYRGVVEFWIEDTKEDKKRPTLKSFFKRLRRYHGYAGSYDAFRRYVRKHYPELLIRGSCVRLETPPGVLLLVDWKENEKVRLGRPGNIVKLQFLCFVLSFSRKMVVRVYTQKNLEAFLHGHREVLRTLGGLPQMVRTDCLKSAVVKWAGLRSTLNSLYRRFLQSVGIGAFPARPGTPEDKGKIEKRIQDLFSCLDIGHRVFTDMDELQRCLNESLCELETEWRCGATGLTVAESFAYERNDLRALPDSFPAPPLKETRTKVRRDGTVFFDGNAYQVFSTYRDRTVLCMNTGTEVRIFHEGGEIGRFPYLSEAKGMVMLSRRVMEDPTLQLSDTTRRWGLEVAERQVEIYHEIIRGRAI